MKIMINLCIRYNEKLNALVDIWKRTCGTDNGWAGMYEYDLLCTIHYEHLFPKMAVNIYYIKKCKNRRMRSNNSDFPPNYSAISMSWCIFGTL